MARRMSDLQTIKRLEAKRKHRRLHSAAYRRDVSKKPPISSFLGASSEIVHTEKGEVKTKRSIKASKEEELS